MVVKDIKGVFFLVFFALITAFVYNQFSPFGIALFGQWEPSSGVVSPLSKTVPVNTSIEINTPEIIQQIVQKRGKIILDVRPREIYNHGHLPTALSFPLEEFDEIVFQLLNTIDRKSSLLVYCSSVECTDSHTFADQLKNLRYDDVQIFSGGFRAWQEKGYAIEKNEE